LDLLIDKVHVAVLSVENGKYFIKSHLIADKNWEYNTKIVIEKADK
jgi:hypothetical protein